MPWGFSAKEKICGLYLQKLRAFANKDTFLDKQGSYILIKNIVLWYHQI